MGDETFGVAKSADNDFYDLIRNPIKFHLFLIKNLPSAYFSGLRVVEVDGEHCAVTVPYKWFTKNPFRSTYFACLSMAAEMSTGVLAMAQTYKKKPAISMLVTGMEAKFYKKARGKVQFICNDGALLRETISRAMTLNTPQMVTMHSIGYSEDHAMVSEFLITWSFKVKPS